MRAFTKSDVSVRIISMVFAKKALLPLFLSVIAAIPLSVLVSACDDAASGSDEGAIEQIEAINTGSAAEQKALLEKYNGTIPDTWTRSDRPYSRDNADRYGAEVLIYLWRENWQGKHLYLAHNFKDEDKAVMYEDIIFYFDNKDSCTDGYYIYLNTLPIESADSDDD